jgi:hypothetical protein
MPGVYIPLKAGPYDAWSGLLVLYVCGGALIVKGQEFHSIGTMAFGGLLIVAGIYYTVRYFIVSNRSRKK